jgi:hypothetical protein
MLCDVCRREARGFGFSPRLIRRSGRDLWLCSMRCTDIAKRLEGMIDPNEHEEAAMRHAGRVGGEYVESLGRTDLSAWSEKEWATLIDVVVTAFQDNLRDAYSRMPVPC